MTTVLAAIVLTVAGAVSELCAQLESPMHRGDGTRLHNNLNSNSQTNNAVHAHRGSRYGNALVTGNVAGLHRFRGNIDYTASREFRGAAAADATFRFRASSITPGSDVRRGQVRVYRAGAGVSGHDLTRKARDPLAGSLDQVYRDDTGSLMLRRAAFLHTARPLRQSWKTPLPETRPIRTQEFRLTGTSRFQLGPPVFRPVTGPNLGDVGQSLERARPIVAVELGAGFEPVREPVRAGELAHQDVIGPRKIEKVAEQLEALRREAQVDPVVAAASNPLAPPRETLKSMATEGSDAYRQAIVSAERFMAEGAYFKAEDEYTKAIRLAGNDGLARIGRAHAQMASGLYLSAAFQLKQTFVVYPELIPNRYTQPILPDAEQIEKIQQDLQRILSDEHRGDAPLLLAYLSYQQNRTNMVDNALVALSRRSGRDPLVEVLRRAWVAQTPANEPPAQPKE